MAAARFEIYGRVQGVGYRIFAQRCARSLGLRGWVRNRGDAAVEVAAIGAAEDLEQFERQLRRGPPASRVERVERSPWRPAANESEAARGFEVIG